MEGKFKMERITEIKKRLKEINKEQRNLDKMIEKQEEDGNFNSSLYDSLRELEEERNNLELELDTLEQNM